MKAKSGCSSTVWQLGEYSTKSPHWAYEQWLLIDSRGRVKKHTDELIATTG